MTATEWTVAVLLLLGAVLIGHFAGYG